MIAAKSFFKIGSFNGIISRKRQKNIYIRISSDGKLRISCPLQTSDNEIEAFVLSHSDWIKSHIKAASEKKSETAYYIEGSTINIWGKTYALKISHDSPFGAHIQGNYLILNVPQKATEQERAEFIKSYERATINPEIAKFIDHWSRFIGVSPCGFRIRDMKSRWGSCNIRTKRLCFNLRLVKKPPQCLEYVVVHELCHLLVPNHSPRFWSHVSICLPDWKKRRKLTNS